MQPLHVAAVAHRDEHSWFGMRSSCENPEVSSSAMCVRRSSPYFSLRSRSSSRTKPRSSAGWRAGPRGRRSSSGCLVLIENLLALQRRQPAELHVQDGARLDSERPNPDIKAPIAASADSDWRIVWMTASRLSSAILKPSKSARAPAPSSARSRCGAAARSGGTRRGGRACA